MKKTTFITTFSQRGYNDHGKYWIETFIKNTSDVNAVIFVDFELYISDPRITILNFNDVIPEHKIWVDKFNSFLFNDDREKRLGIKFSYKSFVMMYALDHISEYVVWLDSDCVFKQNSYANFAQAVLDNKFISVQVDKVAINDWWKTEDHVESGIVIFDMDHPDKDTFSNRFKRLYEPNCMSEMTKPYDGFVIMNACREVQFVDLLPPNYTIMGLDPNLTFIHPELKERFIHNIGHKND